VNMDEYSLAEISQRLRTIVPFVAFMFFVLNNHWVIYAELY